MADQTVEAIEQAAEPAVARLEWKVSNQYVRFFTRKQLENLAWQLQIREIPEDDESLADAVYDALDKQDWRSEEALGELASDRYWSDTGDAEVIDMVLVDGEGDE